MTTVAPARIPLVDYLVLDDLSGTAGTTGAHLVAHECAACEARFFDRRNACGKCGAIDFHEVIIPSDGVVKAFTIVAFAAPGIPVPFVAAVIDCHGTSVRANIINTEPDPEHVSLGMPVRLATFVVGTDDDGTEAIGFGFEPATAEGASV